MIKTTWEKISSFSKFEQVVSCIWLIRFLSTPVVTKTKGVSLYNGIMGTFPCIMAKRITLIQFFHRNYNV